MKLASLLRRAFVPPTPAELAARKAEAEAELRRQEAEREREARAQRDASEMQVLRAIVEKGHWWPGD